MSVKRSSGLVLKHTSVAIASRLPAIALIAQQAQVATITTQKRFTVGIRTVVGDILAIGKHTRNETTATKASSKHIEKEREREKEMVEMSNHLSSAMPMF
jgi:hypothetical protein